MEIPPPHQIQYTSLRSLYQILPQRSHEQFRSILPPIQQIGSNQVYAWGQGLRKELDTDNSLRGEHTHCNPINFGMISHVIILI